MSTRDERLAYHMMFVDDHIKHHMHDKSHAEKMAWRAKMLAHYDDRFERAIERLCRALNHKP